MKLFLSRSFEAQDTDRKGAFFLLLIGVFSMTQIKLGPKIGISEIVCCLAAPFLFLKDYVEYRRDGVVIYFNLLILWMIGALLADYLNDSYFVQVIRGFTVPATLLGVSVCIYHFLRRKPENLKWLLVGIAISSVVSIFVFQRGRAGDMAAEGDVGAAIEHVVEYKLFWSNAISTWLALPISIAYLRMPICYTIPAMITIAALNAMEGGRSAFAVSVLSIILMTIVGKNISAMDKVKRTFPMLIIFMFIAILAIKSIYSYAATHGYLNEEETRKYERQTSSGSSIKSLLISGRGEFFVGLSAALDKPIIGRGSQALDEHGYWQEYVEKYGTDSEKIAYMRNRAMGSVMRLHGHSHIITYWMWHGCLALVFWIYIFMLVIQTMRKRLSYVPAWFGYFAIVLPAFMWDYFFSPLGLRVSTCAMFCSVLYLVKYERNLARRTL